MAGAGNARNGRRIATMMRQSLRTLERRHNNLEFFTEDFRSNATIINAHVLTNLELLNKEVKRIEDTNIYVQVLEQRIVQLEEGMRRILGHLEIEERVICDCGRGRVFRKDAKVSTDQDFPLQPAGVERRARNLSSNQTDSKLEKRASASKQAKDVSTQVIQTYHDVATQMEVTLSVCTDVSTKAKEEPAAQMEEETSDIEQLHTLPTDVTASKTVHFPTGSRQSSFSSVASSRSGLHAAHGNKDETKYPHATKAMIEESKKTDSSGQKALMCHSRGEVKWTPDEERWNKMLKAKADCCFSPWIILPAMLGGHSTQMRVELKGDGLTVKCCIPNIDYNQDANFPLHAHLELKICYHQAKELVNVGEVEIVLKKRAEDVKVFRFYAKKSDLQKPPTFYFQFDNKSTKPKT